MPTRGSKDPNGRALRGRRGFTTFYFSLPDQSGPTPAELAWDAFNARATTDGALTAEAAVSGCLQARFAVIFNF